MAKRFIPAHFGTQLDHDGDVLSTQCLRELRMKDNQLNDNGQRVSTLSSQTASRCLYQFGQLFTTRSLSNPSDARNRDGIVPEPGREVLKKDLVSSIFGMKPICALPTTSRNLVLTSHFA